ncbi:4'-phosphopantetheinyl transferase family protein [Streptomyces sp. RGM 3693]|uniref:4'-phosphopantetheinyl transferase family protein n=1 Tax=Streptomyces sp. RGM 3693 TaxID=3413284 RepID=UPI003D2B333D
MLTTTALTPGTWPRQLPLPTTKDQPHLWHLTTPHPTALTTTHHQILDPTERHQATSLRRPEDRTTYLTAHVSLRMLLAAYLGADPAHLPLYRMPCTSCKGPHGRPALIGHPLHFSLSHTTGLCVLAFAATTVGIDVEPLATPAVADEVAAALHPRETAELRALTPPHRATAFTHTWTRKEALLKALGTGLNRRPSQDYVGTGEQPLAPPGWTISDVTVPDTTYAAAVALRTPTSPPPP